MRPKLSLQMFVALFMAIVTFTLSATYYASDKCSIDLDLLERAKVKCNKQIESSHTTI